MANLYQVIIKNAGSGWNAYVGKHVADVADDAVAEAKKLVPYYSDSEFRTYVSDLGVVAEHVAEEVSSDVEETVKSGEPAQEDPLPVSDPEPIVDQAPESDIEQVVADDVIADLTKYPPEILARIKSALGIKPGSALSE
jgi:hypothetical protein